MLCADCHKYIHEKYEEKYLGRHLNSEQAMKEDEYISRYIEWVKKKK